MKQIFTKKRILMWAPLLFFLVLFLVGSIFDYDIADAIGVNKNWICGSVTAFFPILPYACLAVIGGMSFRLAFDFEKQIVRIFYFVMASGTYGVSAFMTFHEMISSDGLNLDGEMISLLVLALCVVMNFGFAYLGYCLADKVTDKQPDLWLVVFFMVFIAALLIGGSMLIKLFVHRARYSALVSVNSPLTQDDYTNWLTECPSYELYKDDASLDGAFDSFPSGHVAGMSICMVFFPFIASLIPNVRRHTTGLFITAFILTIVMMAVRMICGSHYLTDCAFGAIWGYAPFLIGYEVFFRKLDDVEID